MASIQWLKQVESTSMFMLIDCLDLDFENCEPIL